ncbi:MAG: nucleotidyl transferase AbiEii/AbiGii toxin family protein, partial [Legionellales bacterium]|nr:nucleotidyl transferase AbiEii/AbiGii toxin family protein [Legionellales bacterium]
MTRQETSKIRETVHHTVSTNFYSQSRFFAQDSSKKFKYDSIHRANHPTLTLCAEEGLTLTKDSPIVRDEGKYIAFDLAYPSAYTKDHSLRPNLQIEFMMNESKLATEYQSVTTLVRQILGDRVQHIEKSIECVSVNETAAEKWVALTRRVANLMRKPDLFLDPTLVRHIYDLYCIENKQTIGNDVYMLISNLIKEDINKYKNQNADYAKNPINEIKNALSFLSESKEWEKNWNVFIKDMVYTRSVSYLGVYDAAIFRHMKRLKPASYSYCAVL